MDLTSHHRSLFEKPRLSILPQLYRFGIGVYHSDKWQELFSYVRWELKHQLGLFSTAHYLRFTDYTPALLDAQSNYRAESHVNLPATITKASLPWKMFVPGHEHLSYGCLFGEESTLYVSTDDGDTAIPRYRFKGLIQAMFVSSKEYVFVCVNGVLLRSTNQGKSFQEVLSLSSCNSYFLPNNGMTELPDGCLLIGEYGVVRCGNTWQNLAHIYYSTDAGCSWQVSDFLIQDGVNKHVHLVKFSRYLNSLFLTDGDNKKQLWINRDLCQLNQATNTPEGGWYKLNQTHYQSGGYLSMTELSGKVFFGSDYLGGTNFLVTTTDGRRFQKQVIPDPYRRSPIMNLLTRRSSAGRAEVWAVLHNSIAQSTRSLLMCSADDGQTWTRVIDYDGTHHEIKLVSASPSTIDRLYFAIISRQGACFKQSVFNITSP